MQCPRSAGALLSCPRSCYSPWRNHEGQRLWWVEQWAPKSVNILILWMLLYMAKGTLEMWLIILRENYPGLSRWAQCNHKSSSKREVGGSERERDKKIWWQVRRMPLLKGAIGQGMQVASQSWIKARNKFLPQNLQKKPPMWTSWVFELLTSRIIW